jgi:hypothetical protein
MGPGRVKTPKFLRSAKNFPCGTQIQPLSSITNPKTQSRGHFDLSYTTLENEVEFLHSLGRELPFANCSLRLALGGQSSVSSRFQTLRSSGDEALPQEFSYLNHSFRESAS